MSYLQEALNVVNLNREPKPETNVMSIEKKALPMTEARRESLMAVMEAVWTSEFQGIISKVLGGQAKLVDFKEATKQWAKICAEEMKV